MNDRQFLWGLSNGIIALAIAGVFWVGWGFGPLLGNAGWAPPAVFTVVVYSTSGSIVWLAVRLRRRVSFKRSELKQGDERQRAESQRIMAGFRRVVFVQTILVAAGVLLCFQLGHEELVAPWIALIVSLHFIPLGRIFHVQTYKFVGTVGSAISLVAFSPMLGVGRLMFLGGTMGLLHWLSAIYILRRARQISAEAIRKPWAI